MVKKLTLSECKEKIRNNCGSLDLTDITTPFTLPDGLEVNGYLNLNYTKITHLPKKIKSKRKRIS